MRPIITTIPRGADDPRRNESNNKKLRHRSFEIVLAIRILTALIWFWRDTLPYEQRSFGAQMRQPRLYLVALTVPMVEQLQFFPFGLGRVTMQSFLEGYVGFVYYKRVGFAADGSVCVASARVSVGSPVDGRETTASRTESSRQHNNINK